MLYGPAKRRQMARSILPSRARKAARERLRLIRRAHRRTVAQHLGHDARTRNVDLHDRFDLGDHSRYPQRQIREVVIERRYADTLSHFERWAGAVTRDIPIDDRLPTVRSWLPDGVIGAHAQSHLEQLPQIRARREHDWIWPRYASQLGPERERTRAAIRQVFELGLHGELNRALRRAFGDRLLFGIHDLDAFVDAVVACHRHECHERWCDHPALDALRQFINNHDLGVAAFGKGK